MNNDFRKRAVIVLTDEDLMNLGIDPDTVGDDEFESWVSEVGHELESLDNYHEVLLSNLPTGAGAIENDTIERVPKELALAPEW